MNRTIRFGALLAVSVIALAGCNGRTILHGNGLKQHVNWAARLHPVKTGLNVWFVKPEANSLKILSVSRNATQSDKLQQAVEELLRGPTAQEESLGIGTEIPRGTLLLGLKRAGNDVNINLSRRFASGGGSTSFLTRLDQLRKTVSDPAGRSNVYLFVEGRRLDVEEGEGIEIRQPINR